MSLLCHPDPPLGLVRVLKYDDFAPADRQRWPRHEGAPTDAGGATAEFTNAPPSTAAGLFRKLLDIGKACGATINTLHH